MREVPFYKVIESDDPFAAHGVGLRTLAQHVEVAGGWLVRSRHRDVITGEERSHEIDLTPLKDLPPETLVMVGVAQTYDSPEEAAAYSNAMEQRLGVASGAGTKLPMPRGGIVPAFPDEAT